MILTIVIFLVILAALIFVHELGHFLAAKISGVRVDEFAIGFPPRIFSKKFGETMYSIGCVPLGGFVKIFGEDGEEAVAEDSFERVSLSETHKRETIFRKGDHPIADRSFATKSKWIQIFILVSGIAGNIVFAWLLFSIALSSGLTISSSDAPDYISNDRISISDVLPDSPAAKAGLSPDETILSINGIKPASIVSIQNIVSNSNGTALAITAGDSNNQTKNVSVTPTKGIIGTNYGIGIAMDEIGEAHLPVFLALSDGAKLTWATIKGVIFGFGQIITDSSKGQNDFGAVSGPVGIAKLIGQAEKIGFAYLLSFTAFISLNLAIINLVPFPALDGGRVLFVIIETVRRKNISAKVANTINTIGFAILLLLLVIVTIKDVLNIF